ncbi:P-II family nitrogen regulator [Miniphocaeibacter massiliensis]|uniref:P-II family nitrogen regulator n=1 Tax=Miniphocaeibacter massiliensis TaxID=2041841 RepID=UPI000C1C0694|nr:P-II family nitrogen regulator [Miniphocaeibacter massiliensis]
MYSKDESYNLFIVIVDKGRASKILNESKKIGVKGGTILYGTGTVNSGLLHLLELYEIKKEILIMVIPNELNEELYKLLKDKFHLERPNKGIAFNIPLDNVMGNVCVQNVEKFSRGSDKMNHQAVFVIVERGNADDVIKSADKAGARGATVIHGRGSGVHEKSSIFNIVIEPEKEIVLMLVDSLKTQTIIDNIKEDLNIDKPGKGIVFVVGVENTLGLVKE